MGSSHLNDLIKHLLCIFDSLSRTLDAHFAILTHRDVLVDLDIATGTLLQIINSDPLGTNDSSHVLL